jgi:glycosyltransferase involved in cell wall biosynthesis
MPPIFERIRVVPIKPRDNAHAVAFDELVFTLSSGLRDIGCEVDVRSDELLGKEYVNLIIGASLIEPGSELPCNSIILNFEQAEALKREPYYLERLGRHAVLDYSARNVERIRQETGNPHVHVLGIGYSPGLTRIEPATVQDVDVLFYGSVNPRRRHVLDGLEAAGLKVKTLFGVYGEERDQWIARSRLVLNMHFYDDKVHEIVRSSYLLSNRKAVVCECDGATEIDAALKDAMACAPYERLVETCIRLASGDKERCELERRGFEIFSRRDQAQMLAEVLPKLGLPLPKSINLGSGKDWRANDLNIDIDAKSDPDVVCDLSSPDALSQVHFSRRFGLLRLEPGSFDAIEAMDVLEHVPDLVGMMTRCLELLKVGGQMRNGVPYDLSYGAWQDPTHVRAFNERSWLYYTDWHWYLGWREARFDMTRIDMILSPLGHELHAAGTQEELLFRTPRAVDAMKVVMTKRLLDASERQQALAWYEHGKERRTNTNASMPSPERPMRICLNMIVKNEAHVIERCLRSVRPYIDSWAIIDTGSTDGTQDVIRAALADLPGELIERPWVDFSHNRNEALQFAHRHGDYALIIDADDVFEANADFAWGTLGAPGYMLEIVHSEAGAWWRIALMRLGLDWRWEGVIHEVPNSQHLAEAWESKLHGARIRIVGGGARSRQSAEQKYAHDIDVLRRALVDLPNNPRYTFYLAQTLRDSGQLHEALEVYRQRVEIGGWFEEVYYAKLQVAGLLERTEAGYADVVAAYLDAFDYRPQRAEAPCELARYLRMKERYAAAFAFARIACTIERPGDLLLVDLGVYVWRARDELAVALFYLGSYAMSANVWEELLADARLPPEERERIRTNRDAALQAAQPVAESAA